jgi:WD40-like Beta Propeller Repeat
MRLHTRIAIAAAMVSALGIVGACLGDDPDVATSSSADAAGGADGPSNEASPGVDSSIPIDAPTDSPAEAAAPACDLTKPFATPVRIPELVVNQADVDTAARISPDGRELYLARQVNGTGSRQIVRYTRATTSGAWALDRVIPELSQVGANNLAATAFTLMPDGLTAFYQYYYAAPAGDSAMWATKRTSTTNGNWITPPTPIPGVDSTQNLGDFAPFLSPDGKHVYFQSLRTTGASNAHQADVADGGVTNINRVTITLADGGGAPTNEFGPIVTADLLTMYFGYYTANVPGGGLERYVFRATRTSPTAAFGNGELVSELFINGVFHQPSWVSPDGCTLLFDSKRAPAGGVHIWSAQKPM